MKKRFLASLLSLVMLLTMLPMTAFAASTLEAITNVGTLSVTATKDSDSKLTLSVKTAAEEGQEGEAVNAYSYLLHTKAVTTDDYLSALNAEGATPVAVTDGNLSEAVVTEGQTHIIVYTVVADGETDAGKINAWACAEITPAGAGEPSEPGTISTLSFTATKAADNKVTLAGTGDDASIKFSADNAKYKLGAEADLTQPTDADATKLTGYEAYATDITVNDQSHIAVTYIENGKITKWGKAAITPAATTPTTYTITIDEQIENGGVTVAPTGPVEAGTEVTVTATPDANYKLGTITVTAADKKDVTVTAEHKFTMPASDVTVTATFVSDSTPTHTITVTESQNGTVTTNPADSAAEGATVTITATPSSDDYVVDTTIVTKTGDTATVVDATDGKFTMPAYDVTVTVTFKAVTKYDITIPQNIANGTVTTTPADSAAEGVEVTVNAAPAQGYKLGNITVTKADSTAVTVENGKFTMPAANVTVTATFTEMSATEHAITVTPPTHGAVTTTPATAAEADSEVTINATADAGYEVDATTVTKTGDANTTVTVTDGKFTMPAYDVTVTVTFKATAPAPAEQYTIEFAANGGTGTMAPVKVDKAETGPTEYPVPASTFTAPTGKEFDVWTVAPSTVTITNGKLSIPADFDTATEITLTATWKPAVQKRYIVIAEGITNGTVTTNPPAGVVAVGTEVTVIATPADGYKLGAITVVDYQKNPVAVTGDKFTMPNSDVTVSATFVKEISITEEGNVSTDGNVTADIKPSDADLTAKIEEAKKATGDNKAVTFEVAVSDADADKAKTAEVTLAKTAVDAVAKADVAVIVKTPVATVNVPAATMKKIVAGTATNDVKLVVDKASTTDLGTNTASVGSFDVKFKDSNNKEVKVESALTLTMKVNTTATKVWVYIYKDGKASILGDTDEQYDVVNGEVTFTAPHLTAFVAQEAQDTTAKPETKVELSFETAKNVTGGIVTVTGVEANKLHVIQITKKLSAKEQASVISFAESDQNGVLKFQAQGNSYISVFAPNTTITDPLNVEITDLTALKYEWLATATAAK